MTPECGRSAPIYVFVQWGLLLKEISWNFCDEISIHPTRGANRCQIVGPVAQDRCVSAASAQGEGAEIEAENHRRCALGKIQVNGPEEQRGEDEGRSSPQARFEAPKEEAAKKKFFSQGGGEGQCKDGGKELGPRGLGEERIDSGDPASRLGSGCPRDEPQ